MTCRPRCPARWATALNIAVNARDAMEGGGRLTIRAEEVAAERAFIALSLTDTGAGMDEETIARATEPFFTTKGPGLGTGLGLSMVEGLVEQLGGRLELDSAPGKGTTVRLLLPIAQGAIAPARDTTRQREPEVPGFASRRVLAVDDDALVLMGTEGMLEDLGLEVTVASSATEALALLAKTEFDLLLTDQAMPGMTGTELAERVRADHPDLPIILNTGYAEDPQAPLPQVDYRLGKPFTEAQLATAIESVLPAR
ncbi:response regulator [Sphingomicrobium astaxanthinifaciens]|uniref:response regulator n=1 Tax=Sphingomicrobium astaxanthinifaciens TaxID=1227949 RepID=UPI001FCBE5CA|nr:response regulator [Sphingomicrobium astaxanthinifaciens]MCJ7420765.1 response regulator [Sphingomicrobium astaxanthinifaciens]